MCNSSNLPDVPMGQGPELVLLIVLAQKRASSVFL